MKRFFLIGFQRSGTTLLDYLLNAHPEVVSICEWELIPMIYSGSLHRLHDTDFDSFVKVKKNHNVDVEDYLRLLDTYRAKKISTHQFIEQACDLCVHDDKIKVVGAKEAIPLSRRKFRFMKKLYRDFGKCTDIVFIERDIKGIVNSYMKLGFLPVGNRKISEKNIKSFVKHYVKYMNHIDKILSLFPRTIYVRYRDLMDVPQNTLKMIFEFLGVASDDSTLDAIIKTPCRTSRVNFEGIVSERKEGWRVRLSSDMAGFIDVYYKKNRKFFCEKTQDVYAAT
ncbi:MAG: sulfotransferase [Candidatus Omnitrophica bacterium]|nr:sulfotransferase [Candidatus Omnitrophota bacterium]